MGGGGGGIGQVVQRASTGFVQAGPLGALSNIISGNAADREAEAAQNAAMAQQAAAAHAQAQIIAESKRYENAVMDFAKATPQELQAQERALMAGEKQLASDEKMLAAIDPALLEASQKALSLLRTGYQGGGARGVRDAYQPFEQARAAERQKLVDTLRQQYGPGAETSSIGLKALREFDLASATQSAQFGMMEDDRAYGRYRDSFQGASALSQLFGAQRSGIDLQSRGMNQVGLAGIFQQRQLNARMQTGGQTLAALAGSQAPIIQSAGAQFLGDQYRARYDQAMTNQFMQGAMQFGSAALTAGMAGRGSGGGAAASAPRDTSMDTYNRLRQEQAGATASAYSQNWNQA